MDTNNMNPNQQDNQQPVFQQQPTPQEQPVFQQQPNFQQPQQPVYQQPVYQQPMYTAEQQPDVPMSLGEWVLTLFLAAIPCAGIILLFVWAFGSSTPQSKATWAKAQLILTGIAFVLMMIWYAAIGTALYSL